MDEVKDKKKNSIGRTLVTLVLIGTVAVIGISKTIEYCSNYIKRPRLGFLGQSTIQFKDNLAPGMRAFIEYGDKKIELAPYSNGESKSRTFKFSKEILKVETFKVYAEDRDGNQSKQKRLYTLDGVILEKKP